MEQNRERVGSLRLQKRKRKLDEPVNECPELENSCDQDSSSSLLSNNCVGEHNLSDLGIPGPNADSGKSKNLKGSAFSKESSLVNVSSEEESEAETADASEVKELQQWVVSNNVPHAQVDGLLAILKRRLLPSLPKSTKSLVNCELEFIKVENEHVSDDSEGELEKNKDSAPKIGVKDITNLICTPEPPLATSEALSLEDLLDSANTIYTVDPVDPLHHIKVVDCKTDFEATVLKHLVQLSNLITSIKDKQDEMGKDIARIKNMQEVMSSFTFDKKLTYETCSVDLGIKYQIAIPIPTYEDFLLFDDKLKSDKYFENDVCIELHSLLDKDCVITKSIVNMLKKFLTKEVASMFTAIRSSSINKNKQKFKPTQFCNLIYSIITKVRSEKSVNTSSSDLDNALTDVLSNVMRWKSSPNYQNYQK